ncbi:MAG TPA: hypothetical protein VFO29_04305 [Candidatus Rubrimentiphilum sp.]|nr:hypothetical protein [Candidatus Rubrimentiphilum sp.]
MRHVSRVVPVIICVFGALTLISVLYIVFSQSTVFPDSVPRYMWAITAESKGSTEDDALSNLAAPRDRATIFLERNNFAASSIVLGRANAEKEQSYSGEVEWDANQDISVPADTYARFARLSNRLEIYQAGRKDLIFSFPAIPFLPFANVIVFSTIALLCLSVVSVETRYADVARAPRGMHPVMVAVQTIMSGLLILSSLVEAHLLFLFGPRVLAIVLAIGLISLAAWLYQTRNWWRESSFLRVAQLGYMFAFVAVIGFGVYALLVPVT